MTIPLDFIAPDDDERDYTVEHTGTPGAKHLYGADALAMFSAPMYEPPARDEDES